MTNITDNVRVGTVKGLGNGMPTSGAGFVPAGLTVGLGDPNDLVTSQTGSDVFYDSVNGTYHMALGQGGSTWITLGSVE